MVEPNPNLIDHPIQRDIVSRLIISGGSRFSELKPKSLESNLFMYHLNQLKKQKLVVKMGSVYCLTTEGKIFVDRANLEGLRFRVQPKVINILAIKSHKGNWLILKRLHEPHLDRAGFPSGKIHYGEDLQSAAVRELEEKTGITGVSMSLVGNVLMRFVRKSDNYVINHTIGYVFTANLDDEPPIVSSSNFWESYWGKESDLFEGNVFKGHADILKLIEANRTFIESLDYESDY